jgi:hypothetical protein
MSNGTGFTKGQKRKASASAAKARAISNFSEADYLFGKQISTEVYQLDKFEDELQETAEDETLKAQDRARKAGWGRLVGTLVGYGLSTLLPGSAPLWQKALITAGGGLAGTGAAGGFKDYGIEIESLVPGGILFPTAREKAGKRKERLEESFDRLTDRQREKIGKNFTSDFILGRGFAKAGGTVVGETGETIDDLRALGKAGEIDYGYGDYVKDIMSEAFGIGMSETRIEKITEDDYFNYMNWMDKEGNIVPPAYPSEGFGVGVKEEDFPQDFLIEGYELPDFTPWEAPPIEDYYRARYPNADIITSGSGGNTTNLGNEPWLSTTLPESSSTVLDTIDTAITDIDTVTSSDSLGLLNNQNMQNTAVDTLNRLNSSEFQTSVDTLETLLEALGIKPEYYQSGGFMEDIQSGILDSTLFGPLLDNNKQLGYKRKPNMNVANNLTPLRYIGEMG